MRKLLLLLPLLGVVACANTEQGKLRQAVYDTASAYHVAAAPMPDMMAGKVPGVHLTDAQKTIAKRASQSVYNELATLNASAQKGDTLSGASVSAAQAAFASFETCWTGLKAGTTPDACAAIGGSK